MSSIDAKIRHHVTRLNAYFCANFLELLRLNVEQVSRISELTLARGEVLYHDEDDFDLFIDGLS